MVAKKKFAEYTPIGDELSNVGAFVQAALALDQAASFAIETKDSKAMTNVAMGWIEMARGLGSPDDEDEEEGDEIDMDSSGEDYPLGFASPAVDAEVKKRREENDSKSRSKSRIHTQLG